MTQVLNPVEATKAYIERDTYGFVNTKDVLQAFGQAGWTPVSQNFGRVNNLERQGFQKHLIRLENPKFPAIEGLTNANHSKPQLVLLNSHDGTTSLQILWGLIRVACLNGIIAGTGVNGVRLIHSKSVVDKLPDAIQYMLDNFEKFRDQITALQGKTLSEAATIELIKGVYNARLANVRGVTHIDYTVPRALRFEDKETDAYTIFNRIQEKLMRGGIRYEYVKEVKDVNGVVTNSYPVVTKTRRIASVSSQVKLNQLAYDTAIKLAA
jgi:hypothetical protein